MASIHPKAGKNGKKTYYVVVSFSGRKKWIRAGSLKEAKILKREIESLEESKKREKLGLVARDRRIDDFFEQYLDHVRVHCASSTVKRYRAAVNAFLACLKLFHTRLTHLSQITPEIIESFQRHRLESVELKILADGEKLGNHKDKRLPKPQTVNYEVSVLRSAFIWAYDHEWIPKVPTKKVKPLKPAPKRAIRILSEEECAMFLSTADDMAKENPRLKVYAKAFQFFLNSGLRSGELCNLTWNDIDLETGLIKIQAKAGWVPKTQEREFPLNKTCLRILKSIKTDSDYVFTDINSMHLERDNLRRALIKVAKEAGFTDLTKVHDLRHTFSSLLQMKGVDRGTVATILGHEDEETTLIYTHQTREHLKKSIGKLKIG